MFIAIVFIAIGVAILLNTLGIITGGFWGFFWSIVFIVVGVKLLIKKNTCPFCQYGCECNDEVNCDCNCKEHQHNIEE